MEALRFGLPLALLSIILACLPSILAFPDCSVVESAGGNCNSTSGVIDFPGTLQNPPADLFPGTTDDWKDFHTLQMSKVDSSKALPDDIFRTWQD